jgi:GntR family transcriptional regulator
MFTLDHDHPQPIHEQLVVQLRYLIVSGRLRPGETLPSTRQLARQLGISFHTVRRAYQFLEKQGLLRVHAGQHYTVEAYTPPTREVRLEQGAALLQDTLRRLIGLGLSPEEMDYLFQEQLAMLEEAATPAPKVLCLAPTQELAQQLVDRLEVHFPGLIEPVTPVALPHHPDADFVLARHVELHRHRHQLPQAEWIGLVAYLEPQALERIASMLPRETLGLITRQSDTLPHLITELRVTTGFGGQVLAAALESDTHHLKPLLEQADVLATTSQSRRRFSLPPNRSLVLLDYQISPETLEALRARLLVS